MVQHKIFFTCKIKIRKLLIMGIALFIKQYKSIKNNLKKSKQRSVEVGSLVLAVPVLGVLVRVSASRSKDLDSIFSSIQTKIYKILLFTASLHLSSSIK